MSDEPLPGTSNVHSIEFMRRKLAEQAAAAAPAEATGGTDDRGADRPLQEGREHAPDLLPTHGDYGTAPKRRIPYDANRLPTGCPVTPLGKVGGVCFYLDERRQLRGIKESEHGRTVIQGLYGVQSDLLWAFYPRFNKEGGQSGWRPEEGAQDLMAAAANEGIWDPLTRLRGAGAWADEERRLVLHCGDVVWVGPDPTAPVDENERDPGVIERAGGEWLEPGAIGDRVYPALPAQPRPSRRPAPDGDQGPAAETLSLLRTWSWRRPSVDPALLLGWIGAAMIGGALAWRPMTWLTGDRGTGKSTLQELIEHLMDGGLVKASDVTAAGIWQRIGHNALPIALDELEPDANPDRVQAVIKLARLAASGGLVLRGGQDHQGAEFISRSCFLFSSILVPPLLPQDRSRMAILELDRLTGATPPILKPSHWHKVGAALRRRLMDGWGGFAARLERWRLELHQAGHDARGCDQFGTLMACFDILMHDTEPSGDEMAEWCELLKPEKLGDGEDKAADHERCLDWLLSSAVNAFRAGTQRTVSSWIEIASLPPAGDGSETQEAVRILGELGLKVYDTADERWLAVANSHRGLMDFFRETQWAGRPGAPGVWVQALRRVPGATRHASGVRFGANYSRCTLVPLERVLQRGG